MTIKNKAGKPATDYAEAYQGVADKGQETLGAASDAAADTATNAFTFSRERVEALVKGYDDFAGYSKDTIEALISAGTVATKGVEAINAEILAYSKAALEDSIVAAKAVMAVKSVQELVELQSEFARSAMDNFMQQTTKVGELSAKLTQEAFEPINARVQAAVEKLVKPLAA